ncbi:MAG TPA: DUF2314 domain-containing protein [Allosphingosinicella sp.]|nr:DUF2314 domain-containing protein [Allosphingosinicella sp.]
MSLRYLCLVLALVGGGVAAGAGVPEEVRLVLELPLADPGMRGAISRARAELPGFYERLARPAPDEGEFMVAYDAIPGKAEELVWIDEIVRSAKSIAGVVKTEVQRASVNTGDRVTIADAQVLDWAYRKGKAMQGAYTTRVLIGRMSADESLFLREYLGW